MRKIKLAFAIVLLIAFGFYLYYREGSLPINSKDNSLKLFVINRGDNVTDIAKNLEKADLIRNRIIFFFIIKQLGIDKKIQAGDYRLSPSMSANSIAQSLTRGTNDIWITVIEGLRREEVAQIVGYSIPVPPTELVRRTQEGYLFPDTYLVPKTATIDDIITMFDSNFNKKFEGAKKQRTSNNGLTDKEIITLASLVEKEARSEKNKRIVASILYKRFKNDWPLQVDATVQYALGYQENENTWWKKNLTYQDLAINSPYNTYKSRGLPPTPIASPGLVSIKAAMDASENTPYWYYITSRDGSVMRYATTQKEHDENVRKYLR